MISTGSKEKREALLDELESIRELLESDRELTAEESLLIADDIPLLLPDQDDDIPTLSLELDGETFDDVSHAFDNIPMLLPDDNDAIPLLSETASLFPDGLPSLQREDISHSNTVVRRAVDLEALEAAIAPAKPAMPADQTAPVAQPPANPLDAIRAAAAKVAANAARHRPIPSAAVALTNAQEKLQEPAPAPGGNPFLPQHIRNRLHGTELPQFIHEHAASALAATVKAAEHDTAALDVEIDAAVQQVELPMAVQEPLLPAAMAPVAMDYQSLIDEIVQRLMPILESKVREVLAEKLAVNKTN